MFQTKYDAIDGRSRDNKKDSTIKSFPLLFRVRTVKPQLIEKPRLFSLFSSFSLSFCSKAPWMQGRTAFLRPAHVNPALHTSAFTVVFFFWGGGGGILRVRGFTGLMMTIIHKQSCEKFVNVFNSSILYWLTADSKRVEYSVNVTNDIFYCLWILLFKIPVSCICHKLLYQLTMNNYFFSISFSFVLFFRFFSPDLRALQGC